MKARTVHFARVIVLGAALVMGGASAAGAESGAKGAKAAAASSGGAGKASKKPKVRAGVARTPKEIALCLIQERSRGEDDEIMPELADEPIQLRSKPVDLPDDGCERSIKRWSFLHDGGDSGCFVNVFTGGVLGHEVIADLATGLLWDSGTQMERTFKEAEEDIRRTNKNKLGGFSDWRLPTTEEFLSILEKAADFNLDRRLFSDAPRWWTSDYKSAGDRKWIVDTLTTGCKAKDPSSEGAKYHVRAVRTMSKEEWEAARAKYEKWKASKESK